MIKVFIVEEAPYLLDDMVSYLNHQGFDCSGGSDAKSVDNLISKNLPDIVVLDWRLSDDEGLLIAQQLRNDARTNQIGIIFLTSRGRLDDRVIGLKFVDSYHIKPIDLRELAAVISSIYRRLSTNSFTPELVWQLHEKTLELYSPDGVALTISYREFIILRELALSPTNPVSAQQIVETWGENWLTYEKNRLELLLSRLRAKIKLIHNDKSNPIRAMRNQGYHLMIPIELTE